jgi:hypothetical protein
VIFLLHVTNNAVVSGLILKPVAEKRPSVAFLLPTGRSFVVAAYREVRLWPAHRLAGVASSRSLFVATPLSGFQELPRTGFRRAQLASACLREAPPPEALRRAGASAKAGSFLSNLRKMTFSAALRFLLYFWDLFRARLHVGT